MTFKLQIDTPTTYIKLHIAGKAIHEAALLAYYCEGKRQAVFHEDVEREVDALLTTLGVDARAIASAIDEATEALQYQVENLRAALRYIEDLPPREIEEAWGVATRALRDNDEFAALPLK